MSHQPKKHHCITFLDMAMQGNIMFDFFKYVPYKYLRYMNMNIIIILNQVLPSDTIKVPCIYQTRQQ